MVESLNLDQIESKEIVPGYHGKMIHAASMTIAYWQIEEGYSIPVHQHVHEQVVNMLEGEFELVVDGTPFLLKPGDIVVIPPNIPHGGRSIKPSRILDVFQPARDDYR